MYVAVSMVDNVLGEVQLRSTFEEIVEIAIQMANSWPPIVSNFDINCVKERLTNIHTHYTCDPDNGISYSIHIGKTG